MNAALPVRPKGPPDAERFARRFDDWDDALRLDPLGHREGGLGVATKG